MNPTQWLPVLRRDSNVLESTSTLVKRMQMNLRFTLGKSNWVQATTYVVSLRKDAANRNPFDVASLVQGDDYIISSPQEENARLNPAVFKVHFAKNVSLMSNSWRQPEAVFQDSTFTSNSEATFDKEQVNMKLDFRLRQPTTPQSWKQMVQEQLIATQRLYILTFFKGSTNEPDDDPPVVSYDCLYTCYNAS